MWANGNLQGFFPVAIFWYLKLAIAESQKQSKLSLF